MLAERPLPEDLADRIDALSQAWSGDPFDADARWRKRRALLSDACQRLGTDAVDLVLLEEASLRQVLDAGLAGRLREKRFGR